MKKLPMKVTPRTLKGVEVLNALIREQNHELRERLDLRKKFADNSLAHLSGGFGMGVGAFGQAPITSFSPLQQNNVYAPLTLDWTVLMYAFKSHGLIQALCEMPVLDAVRGGINIRSVDGRLDEEDVHRLSDALVKKDVLKTICSARTWTRVFGGGGLIAVMDQPSDTPLNLKALAKDGELEFMSANRWELTAPWRTAKSFNYYGRTLDASRVRTMVGKESPYTIRWQLGGWGMSELERALAELNTYFRVKNVIYELLYEAKVDVWKFKDFANQMLSAEAEGQTNKRMGIMNAQKSYNNAVLMDLEDEYQQKQLTFSGLAEVYREARVELAGNWRIPMTRLFGLPSTGLSTNEDDNDVYNGLIESEVRDPMRPDILWALELMCIAMFGEPFKLDFEYKPLRVLGAEAEEKIKKSQHDRLMDFYDRGLIDPPQLAEQAAKFKLFAGDVKIDANPEPPGQEEQEEDDGGEGSGSTEKPS